MKHIAILILVSVTLFGCTENQRAKSFGGTATVDLPAGEKLTGATWKEENLWYLTRPMRVDEQPEKHTLREQSSLGMVEGKVVFKEKR
jgi:hypothetical protein